MNFSWPSILLYACSTAGLLAVSGCDQLPGKPKESDRWQPPEAVKDFKTLLAPTAAPVMGTTRRLDRPSPCRILFF